MRLARHREPQRNVSISRFVFVSLSHAQEWNEVSIRPAVSFYDSQCAVAWLGETAFPASADWENRDSWCPTTYSDPAIFMHAVFSAKIRWLLQTKYFLRLHRWLHREPRRLLQVQGFRLIHAEGDTGGKGGSQKREVSSRRREILLHLVPLEVRFRNRPTKVPCQCMLRNGSYFEPTFESSSRTHVIGRKEPILLFENDTTILPFWSRFNHRLLQGWDHQDSSLQWNIPVKGDAPPPEGSTDGTKVRKQRKVPHSTMLPGLQFSLAGILGKPETFYQVPVIRFIFEIFGYM